MQQANQEQQLVAIPSSMRYSMSNIKSVSADMSLRRFASSNGSVFSSTVNEIRIPVSGSEGFLDACRGYLYFTISNKNSGSTGEKLSLSGDALCWVDSIRLESQGVLLERLDRAALWNNLKNKWTKGISKAHELNALQGMSNSFSLTNTGEDILKASQRTFCCKLPLGFLCNHHEKALPQGVQFDIVIRVNPDPVSAFIWETADKYSYEILNPRFYCPMYRVENRGVMSEYARILQEQPVSWTGDSVKTYISSLASGAGTTSIQINDRSKSLKALVSAKRVTADLSDRTKSKQDSTNITDVTDIVYQIEGKNYPQDAIQLTTTEYARLYEECKKAFERGPDYSNGPQVHASDFKSGGNMGLIAVDLKHFDDEKLTHVGIDTTGGSPNNLQITVGSSAVVSDVTTFAVCDCTWSLQSNGMITVDM
jgi:hypothetical protein